MRRRLGTRVVGQAIFNVVFQENVIGADVTGVIVRQIRGDGILIDSVFATIQHNLIALE